MEVPETPAAEPEKDAEKGAKITPEQWEAIRESIAMGEQRASDCARKYGISNAAVSLHLTKHGITYACKKKDIEARAEEKLRERVAETFADKVLKRSEETKEAHYQAAAFISSEITRVVVEAKKAARPIGLFMGDLKALNVASMGLERGLNQRYRLLGIDDQINEQDLPTLEIVDLTEENIRAMQQREDPGVDIDAMEMPVLTPEDEIIIEDTHAAGS